VSCVLCLVVGILSSYRVTVNLSSVIRNVMQLRELLAGKKLDVKVLSCRASAPSSLLVYSWMRFNSVCWELAVRSAALNTWKSQHIKIIQTKYLRFSRRRLWRIPSSVMWRRVTLVTAYVSGVLIASTIRVRRISELVRALAFHRNVCSHKSHTASHRRRRYFSNIVHFHRRLSLFLPRDRKGYTAIIPFSAVRYWSCLLNREVWWAHA
jgi:hypothetical protein